MSQEIDVVVAGHICLDIAPTLSASQSRAEDLFVPGRLIDIGPASVTLGGAVSNTGLALHRLGLRTRLVGKIGGDLLGQATVATLESHSKSLADGMVKAPQDSSSYTIVLNPPGTDRCFLHHSGTNDTFVASDLSVESAAAGRLLHFGYPPLMRGLYADGGAGFARQWSAFREAGVMTSLDMAMPDPESPAGRVDWAGWFATVLPFVDIVLPSFDEVLLMLDLPRYRALVAQAGGGNPAAVADIGLIREMADQLLAMGASIAGLKLGDQGLYLRTADDVGGLARRRSWGRLDVAAWSRRELLVPCFDVTVCGTTGAGDSTVAGFLAALLHGCSAEETARMAVGVGAYRVTSRAAFEGIPAWDVITRRVQDNWLQQPSAIKLEGWQRDESLGLWRGPDDAG